MDHVNSRHIQGIFLGHVSSRAHVAVSRDRVAKGDFGPWRLNKESPNTFPNQPMSILAFNSNQFYFNAQNH